LLSHEFVQDNSQPISQMLDTYQKGLTVSEFARIALA